MYLIMLASYGVMLFLGALLYKHVTDKRRETRKRGEQHPA